MVPEAELLILRRTCRCKLGTRVQRSKSCLEVHASGNKLISGLGKPLRPPTAESRSVALHHHCCAFTSVTCAVRDSLSLSTRIPDTIPCTGASYTHSQRNMAPNGTTGRKGRQPSFQLYVPNLTCDAHSSNTECASRQYITREPIRRPREQCDRSQDRGEEAAADGEESGKLEL